MDTSEVPAYKTFNLMSGLTVIAVTSFIGFSGYALVQNSISYADFAATVGPIVGLLVGYWRRDTQG